MSKFHHQVELISTQAGRRKTNHIADRTSSSPIWIVPKKMPQERKNDIGQQITVKKTRRQGSILITNHQWRTRCNYFTTIEIQQLEINEENIPKNHFQCKQETLRISRIAFGLKRVPATYQRILDNALRALSNTWIHGRHHSTDYKNKSK